ncbi:uncharacterized protein LOC123865422 [Maniola jurtina]|uniref:uncharacterized protein LOC123865422 n=1 Tax=Maniola jurtina TaxID=191418 RepID=UPI001E687A23|nr:uncharacterized protein LOC123865422 [Maniola jurtina]
MKTIEHFIFIFNILLAVNVFITSACPREMQDVKAAYKSGEILDQSLPITLATIKRKLKESGIFNWQDPTLNEREKKELSKLFDVIAIMTTSRARQPSNVQNMFSSLRLVERVVKKQLKQGQISESLAAKFHWEKLPTRHRREKPTYYLDKKTSMRVFNTMN